MDRSLVFISAGEHSGDNAAARLAAALRDQVSGLHLFGLGGERLKQLGQVQLAEAADLAVVGFWEVLKRYFFFRRLMLRCIAEIEKRRPACIILVDYPGFNLRLAERIKHLGIPIVYYISPQVWAWGRGRLAQIRRLVDLALLILPFEKDLYDRHGIPSEFVGHYLLEDIPESLIGSEPGQDLLAVLPGSRPLEVSRMLPSMLKAAAAFNRKHGTRAVVAGVPGVANYERYLQRCADESISLEYGRSRDVIRESRLVLTASGTATLEAGIIGRPMLVVYRTGFITYQVAKRLVDFDKIALVNWVLDGHVVPELIQGRATASHMTRELEQLWTDGDRYQAMRKDLLRLPGVLGGTGASAAAARRVREYLVS